MNRERYIELDRSGTGLTKAEQEKIKGKDA
jgi:hypothetical protein